MKYLNSSNYNKFKKEMLDAKIKEKRLVHISDICNFINNSDLNIIDKGRIKSTAR